MIDKNDADKMSEPVSSSPSPALEESPKVRLTKNGLAKKKPGPKGTGKPDRTNIRFPSNLKKLLEEKAKTGEISLNKLVVSLVTKAINLPHDSHDLRTLPLNHKPMARSVPTSESRDKQQPSPKSVTPVTPAGDSLLPYLLSTLDREEAKEFIIDVLESMGMKHTNQIVDQWYKVLKDFGPSTIYDVADNFIDGKYSIKQPSALQFVSACKLMPSAQSVVSPPLPQPKAIEPTLETLVDPYEAKRQLSSILEFLNIPNTPPIFSSWYFTLKDITLDKLNTAIEYVKNNRETIEFPITAFKFKSWCNSASNSTAPTMPIQSLRSDTPSSGSMFSLADSLKNFIPPYTKT